MHHRQPKVISVVLTWNSADFIEECLDSLHQSNYKTDIIVVDNDSVDKTREIITKKFPKIKLINTGENLGYAGGNNIGIKMAIVKHADYIFILNPDAIVDKNCIGKMLERLEQDNCTIAASPKIYYYNTNYIWFIGSDIHWLSGDAPHSVGEDRGQFNNIHYTQRINGCAVMLRAQQIQDVGLMDSRYFLYYEDVDWSVMLTKAGFKLGIVPSAIVQHKVSSSTGDSSPLYYYYMTRNKLLFIYKNKPIFLPIAIINSFYKSFRIVLSTFMLYGAHQSARIIISISKGYFDFAVGKFYKQDINKP